MVKSCILLHRDYNVIIFKGIPWELTEKILFQEICPLMKPNVRHQQQSHLFTKWQNVLTCKFTINQLLFYYKWMQALLWSGTASSGAGIIKCGRYDKAGQSGAIITKVVQWWRQLRQTEEGNRFPQLTPILIRE